MRPNFARGDAPSEPTAAKVEIVGLVNSPDRNLNVFREQSATRPDLVVGWNVRTLLRNGCWQDGEQAGRRRQRSAVLRAPQTAVGKTNRLPEGPRGGVVGDRRVPFAFGTMPT
jgi:hypothetical protein